MRNMFYPEPLHFEPSAVGSREKDVFKLDLAQEKLEKVQTIDAQARIASYFESTDHKSMIQKLNLEAVPEDVIIKTYSAKEPFYSDITEYPTSVVEALAMVKDFDNIIVGYNEHLSSQEIVQEKNENLKEVVENE